MDSSARNPAFATVLLVELWERFGYYGVQGLLLLFTVERLGLPDRQANLLLGAFSALVYALPAVGGSIGDKLLGARRCVPVGAAILALGYAMLTVPGGRTLLFASLATVAVGNGFFKANAANLVRRIFEGDDAKLDGAFTLYYMAVNVGSTVSLLLCPWLRDRYGWRAAFGVCCAGLLFGLAQFVWRRRLLAQAGSAPDDAPLRTGAAALVGLGAVATVGAVAFVLQQEALARAAVYLAAVAIAAIWAWLYRNGTGAERRGLAILYVLVLEVMLFFVFYQQMSTSLTLFASRAVDLRFFLGPLLLFRWSPAQFQALDPIFIMAASPILAILYGRLGARGQDLHIATKYTIGFALTAGAFLVWWLASAASTRPMVSSWVMVAGYGLLATGELLVSGLGLAVIARYVPARLGGFMMGSYFVAVGIAMYAGSAVANGAAIAPGATGAPLGVYAGLFEHLFWLGCGATLLSAAVLPVVRALERGRMTTVGARPVAVH